ncbi:hypothetical protein [Leifsonia shinshuensis]|uniref:Uncharacterized protein n=1 Tax=Leifsonia shinshuensis TaxID=150026 RepID=A0A7G6YDW8_9MICO|nr:hypothetical protein [Leifsonia shinshuensis]QNE36683.1 hypothetical protein F1C12_17225 [Leifsonia shinshuensis]
MRRPSQRTWIILGLSAAVVIAAGAFVISQAPVQAPTTAAGSSPTASHSTPATGSGSKPGSTGSTDTPLAPVTPPAVTKRYTTEVLPAAPATSPALPPTTPLPYPVSAPLPKSAAAVGALAAGYPTSVLPQAPGSTIKTSSIASQSNHLQVTLTAGSTQQVTDVVAFYRGILAKYGMYDSAAPALAGSTSALFVRGGNSVTLTVTPATSGTTYALFAAFTAAG